MPIYGSLGREEGGIVGIGGRSMLGQAVGVRGLQPDIDWHTQSNDASSRGVI